MKRIQWVLTFAVMMIAVSGVHAWAKGSQAGAGGPAQVSSEQREQFLKDTEPMRQAIWEKRSQLNALLSKQDSDPAQIGLLEKEIHQLREQMREKAEKAGMGCPRGAGGCGMGYGMGMGRCNGLGMGQAMHR